MFSPGVIKSHWKIEAACKFRRLWVPLAMLACAVPKEALSEIVIERS